MRRRMIAPEIWSDGDFQKLPCEAQVLFLGHISAADDEGRGSLVASDFKVLCFAQKPELDDAKVAELMKRLESAKAPPKKPFVVYYDDGRGAQVWALPNWRKYQTIDRPRPSSIPSPAAAAKTARRGEAIKPAQVELLRVMALERGIDLVAFLAERGQELERLLAREVTGVKQALEAAPARNGKEEQEGWVRSASRVIRIAAQRRDWSVVEAELDAVDVVIWPKVRAEILRTDSRLEGSTMAEVVRSLREVYS